MARKKVGEVTTGEMLIGVGILLFGLAYIVKKPTTPPPPTSTTLVPVTYVPPQQQTTNMEISQGAGVLNNLINSIFP